MRTGLLAVVLLASLTEAHVALWHPAMYGFCDGGNGKNDTCINTSFPVNPLMGIDYGPGVGGQGWNFHGNKDQPPAPGVYLELPSGGKVMTELNCNKGLTSWNIGDKSLEQINVCAKPISVHTADTWEGGPTDATKGCAIALAWESDADKVQPEDFTVITTVKACPFYLRTTFDIPADLPPCPEGGCIGNWLWIHGAGPAGGSTFQMYLTPFKAMLTGTTATAPLPRPRVAKKCLGASNICVKGPKFPHYWGVNDRMNAYNPDYDPPYYNSDYNFPDGAQADLRYVPDVVAENAWKDDWEYIGCWADDGPTRTLQAFKTDSWQNDPDWCRSTCSDLGYKIAALQYGVECYCDNTMSITGSGKIPDDGTYCNMPCQGNASATCGSGYISNVYAKKDALLPIGALPSASATTSTVAAQSSAAASSFVSELNSSASSSASVSSVVKSASSAISAYSSASSAAYTSALSSMVSSMSSASQASATSASLATSPTAQAVAGRPAASPASDSVASRCITPEQSSRREAALSTQAAPTSSTAALVGREVVEEEEDDLTAPVISQDALAHALAEHRRRSLKRWLVHGHQD